ncbi:MAG: DUF4280 domain-containing protein [Oscillospiraceae bacterium]|nr:DUF4280 domain-containing protein [Oscillospiraceae bacterium]
MALLLTGGVSLACSFGTMPTQLNVLPESKVFLEGKPVARMSDAAPNVNIIPFGLCSSLTNPAVASATAAALGVLTPQPCTPMLAGGWQPCCAAVIVGGQPAAGIDGSLQCAYAGQIRPVAPGQASVIAN